MRVIGMLRVKNESRWIERVLRAAQPACDGLIVFDDHSTDETAAIVRGLGIEVIDSPFKGLDESRDKNFLLARTMRMAAEWVLHIDGDEELEPGAEKEIRRLIPESAKHVYSFQVLYLWDRPDQVRVDGIYGHFRRPSLFRAIPGARFINTGNGGNFHCGNVPRGLGKCWESSIRLLHYGYMSKEDRIAKYSFYNSIKPVPQIEDGYRHMILGDLLPAKTRTRHAGPLRLEPLSL